jgi:hypothetical protein
MNEPDYFKQHVCEDGYIWQECMYENVTQLPCKGAVLLPKNPRNANVRDVVPMDNSKIFREFSNLYDKMQRSEVELRQAIVDFANKYGFLRNYGWHLSDDWDSLFDTEYGAGENCVPLVFWKDEICRLNRAVELLKLLRRMDDKYVKDERKHEEQLRKLITWENPKYSIMYFRADRIGYRGNMTLKNGEKMKRYICAQSNSWLEHCYPDIRVATRQIVAYMINEMLTKKCQPRIMLTPVSQRNGKASGPHLLAFHYVPNDLLTAMWLQVGQWLLEKKQYNLCQNPDCKEWFEVGSKRRMDSRYCSESCKQAVNNAKRPKTRVGRRGKHLEGLS